MRPLARLKSSYEEKFNPDYVGAILDLSILNKDVFLNKEKNQSPKIIRHVFDQPVPKEMTQAAQTVNKSRLLKIKESDPFACNYSQNLFKARRETSHYEYLQKLPENDES